MHGENINHSGILFVVCKNQNPENISGLLLNVFKSEMTEKFRDSLVAMSERQVIIIREDK